MRSFLPLIIKEIIKAISQELIPNLLNLALSFLMNWIEHSITILSNPQYNKKKSLFNICNTDSKSSSLFLLNSYYILWYSFKLLKSLNNFLASLIEPIHIIIHFKKDQIIKIPNNFSNLSANSLFLVAR